ncbi:FAD/NAD(P)-binding protein [Zavarzinia compransoris]|nr:FAD/NAD(P)-binding protein [Zavarzinia compransoris]TDP49127.1 putative NAD(P)/FAD-binding protein YdhS [Zavarzinia compransoris]
MSHFQTPRVAVIGGGFTGAAFAAQLAGKARGPVAIDIVEPRTDLGRGVAYGTADPAHRINVPSTRMSVYPDQEDHFDRWLQRQADVDADAALPDGRVFPRRELFGRYVGETLAAALAARPDIAFRHHRDRALAIAEAGGTYRITLGSGDIVTADLIVLAASHPPPAPPALLAALDGAPGYVADPWAPAALAAIPPEAAVLIVGTGLTMADIVASLELQGHRGPITAVSRRGLLSRGHVARPVERFGQFTAPPSHSALHLLRRIRATVRAAAAEDQPWQAVLDAVRSDAQEIWQHLPLAEQGRLLRFLRPFWDVHRYRVAPQAEAAIERARAAGRFRLVTGHLAAARPGIELEVARGNGRLSLKGDALVVATGPGHGSVIATSPALQSLADAGLIAGDALGLGLATDRDDRALDARGRPNARLLVAGPLARAAWGELMGLPQVSLHAARVADHVAAWAATGTQRLAASASS